MKILSRVILGLVVVGILVTIIGFLLPSKVYLSRSIVVRSSPAAAFVEANSPKRFCSWSAWRKLEPEAEYNYLGPTAGVGAILQWKGEKVGTGTMTITQSKPYEIIKTALYFDDDQEEQSPSYSNFMFTPIGEDSVKIVFDFETNTMNNPFNRYMGLFMESMMGPPYEQSLQSLKEILEAAPPIAIEEITMPQSMKVVGYRSSFGKDQSLKESMERTFPRAMQLASSHNLETPTYTTVYFLQDTAMDSGVYLCGILNPTVEIDTTQTSTPIEEKLYAHTLSSGLHLKATYKGPYDELDQAYHSLETYVKRCNLTISAPVWEVYLVSYDQTSNPDEFETLIYFPVQKSMAKE